MARRSPICCNTVPVAAESGVRESSEGTDIVIVVAIGPEPVMESGRVSFGSGSVAALGTWRPSRAAGSEAERARSQVAAVASAKATLRARRRRLSQDHGRRRTVCYAARPGRSVVFASARRR